MDAKELYVGRKVWLKPNALYKDQYSNLYKGEYLETEVTKVGPRRFYIRDEIRPAYVYYNVATLKECPNTNKFSGSVLLFMDESIFELEKKEQLIIRIRKYFNSRLALNADTNDLQSVVDKFNL